MRGQFLTEAHHTEGKVATDDPGAAPPQYVVDIVGLRKSFQRRTRAPRGYSTLKSAALGWFSKLRRGRPAASSESGAVVTPAIKDLTLRIPRGASVGLIGRNGSGKSTFLKLVTGIYRPDAGRISVCGRVSALIELGAGFHPDFTGRENLILAGVMHGLTREQIAARFDQIVSFAELEHVIDDPVRTYSSGMFMRLGFSIAIHTDPDILLVDEVLAVGDAGFVAKCRDRIADLRRQGKTLVLVTHDLEAVERWCDEVVWLHNGEVRDRGYPRRVIDAYRQFIEQGEEQQILSAEHHGTESPLEHSTPGRVQPEPRTVQSAPENFEEAARWGSREVEVVAVELCDRHGVPHRVLHPDSALRIQISYRVHAPQSDLVFGIGITRADGLMVYGTNTHLERLTLPPLQESGTVECVVDRIGLLEASYALDVAVHREDGYPFDYHKGVLKFSVRASSREVGVVSPPHRWVINGAEVDSASQQAVAAPQSGVLVR